MSCGEDNDKEGSGTSSLNSPDHGLKTSFVKGGTHPQKGVLFLFDLGYFKIKAFACIAAAGAYFLSRLKHQTTLLHTESGQVATSGPGLLAHNRSERQDGACYFPRSEGAGGLSSRGVSSPGVHRQ